MADETKTLVDTGADTAKAEVEATGETAKQANEATVAGAKRVAKTAKSVTKKAARRVKAQRKTRRPARHSPAFAANKRTEYMNTKTNNPFAAFGAFPSAPFQSLFAEAGERGQETIRRSQQAVEQIADLTRANVEALVDSGRIAAEGARTIGQDLVDTGREGIEQAADAVRSLAEAKSATEFVQLQGEFARQSFDRLVAESSRLTESMVKLAGEAIQPISSRASLNAERLNQFVA